MSISGFLCAILFFKSSRDDVGLGRRKTQFAIDDFLKLQETGFSSKHTNNIQAPSSLIFLLKIQSNTKKCLRPHYNYDKKATLETETWFEREKQAKREETSSYIETLIGFSLFPKHSTWKQRREEVSVTRKLIDEIRTEIPIKETHSGTVRNEENHINI